MSGRTQRRDMWAAIAYALLGGFVVVAIVGALLDATTRPRATTPTMPPAYPSPTTTATPDTTTTTTTIAPPAPEPELAASPAVTEPAPSPGEPTTTNDRLACIRANESDTAGGYSAVSPGGTYLGAYQFLQTTWDTTAAHADRHDLVGIDPSTVSPADQDAMAEHLLGWQGGAPWGDKC